MSDENNRVSVSVVGPNIQKLEMIASQSEKLELCATGNDGTQDLAMKVTLSGGRHRWVTVDADPVFHRKYFSSIGQGLIDVNAVCRKLVLESIVAKGSKTPLTGKELRRVAIAAWCEAAGMPIPSEAEMDKLLATPVKPASKPQPKSDPRKAFVQAVRASGEGAKLFGELHTTIITYNRSQPLEISHLKKCDFSQLKLDNAKLPSLEYESSNFDGASMNGIVARCCNFKRCSFKSTSLTSASMKDCRCLAADFTQANLSHATVAGATLSDAKFQNANLTGADLSYADICGADFTDADLTEAIFDETRFDEQTKFPANFDFPNGLRWAGKGMDPLMIKQIKSSVAAAGSVSFDKFLERLQAEFDKDRIKKALKMLQAERFQLFSEVKENSVLGIVKSQTDPDLVYSCSLSDAGQFFCCTQNLNHCGGLRGALCKHLLVLLIGLTRAGELDATTACAWVVTSCMQKPVLDKDTASEVFLRYKGAEAGDIDWRPTETMPEDYYAF